MRHARAVLLIAGFLVGCREYKVIEEASAPDGRHRAVIFTTRIGGTGSDLHTSVSVLSPSGGLRWPPNAFTATHGPGVTPAGPYFGPRVQVRWIAPDTLEITHDPRASLLRRYADVRGVHVRYRAVLQQDAGSPGLPSK